MKLIHQITADAVTIRGIIDYLEKSVEPATLHELAMTQHISNATALRLCRLLEKEGVVEHPRATRVILGVSQEVPLFGWRLTEERILAIENAISSCVLIERYTGQDLRQETTALRAMLTEAE